jgi:Stage II sporulation protein E (SpoIIE)
MRLALLGVVSAVGLGAVGLAHAQTPAPRAPAVSTTIVPQASALPSTGVAVPEAPSVTVSVPSTTVGPVSAPTLTVSTPSSGRVASTPVPPAPAVPPVTVPPVSGGSSAPSAEAPANAPSANQSRSTVTSGAPAAAATGERSASSVAPGSQQLGPTTPARSHGSRPHGAARLASGRGGSAGSQGSARPRGSAQPAAAPPRTAGPSQGDALDAIGGHIPLPLPVPDWSKPIIAALLLLALYLGVRSRVAALRARGLERQRASLLRDVGFMQAALVPEVPARLGGLAVSVAYRPAEGPAAGGDFYDVFIPAPGKVAVILGDVAGHGHDALRQAALIRYTLRAYIQAGLEPRMALALAGRALGQPRGEYFATVAVGIYDRRGSRLTYSLAGHPPPIFRGFAAPEPLTICSSPPVGWTLPTGRRQSTLTLPPRSEVCFFSDGLVEARAQGGLLGRERLSGILGELGPQAQATELLERVRAAALETRDDMAACILAPEVGTSTAGPRVEELEADISDLISGEVERFLEACRISRPVIARTLDHASDIAAASGAALLRIELGPAGATVTAAAAAVADLVPLAAQAAEVRADDGAPDGPMLLPVEQPTLTSLPLRRAADRQQPGPATAELL